MIRLDSQIDPEQCVECKTAYTYNIRCAHCRTRLALDEPCKLLRRYLVESLGEVDGWQSEPHCGCERQCKRRMNVSEQNIA